MKMRQEQQSDSSTQTRRRGPRRHVRAWVLVACFVAAVVAPALLGLPSGDTTVSAQTSPLSPLVVPGGETVEPIPFQALTFDPMASGHAGLWRALLVLFVVVSAAVVMVWRQT